MTRRIGVIGARPPLMATPAEMASYDALLGDVAGFIYDLPPGVVVVSGGAMGVDTIAAKVARDRGLSVKEHFPNYAIYSRAQAPLERNTVLVADVTELHAWPSPTLGGSSLDSVAKAKARGIPVTVHKVTL